MNMQLDLATATGYSSRSQQARVVTEAWVARNMYCPVCGAPGIVHDRNNSPVSDFICPYCGASFELISTNNASGHIPDRLLAGAYDTAIERIKSANNPHLFVMGRTDNEVSEFMFVPNFFFTPSVVKARPTLLPPARRAGWTGCTIMLKSIPDEGKLFIVRNGRELSRGQIAKQYNRLVSLCDNNMENRCWMMDTLSCVNQIGTEQFTLQQMYDFEDALTAAHPANNNVRAKIRQQLQMLRDRGFVEFLGRGTYRRICLV